MGLWNGGRTRRARGDGDGIPGSAIQFLSLGFWGIGVVDAIAVILEKRGHGLGALRAYFTEDDGPFLLEEPHGAGKHFELGAFHVDFKHIGRGNVLSKPVQGEGDDEMLLGHAPGLREAVAFEEVGGAGTGGDMEGTEGDGIGGGGGGDDMNGGGGRGGMRG